MTFRARMTEAEFQQWRRSQPHVVVFTGYEGSKRFANVTGPFDDWAAANRHASNARAKINRDRFERGRYDHYKIKIHVRPLMDPEGVVIDLIEDQPS